MRTIFLFCGSALLCLAGACASVSAPAPSASYLNNLACRIVQRVPGDRIEIIPLSDVNLDTLSSLDADLTFDTVLHGNRKLSVSVRSVKVSLPRDRFNVSMKLDGKPHMKLNHIDLDIYIETAIDDVTYALHCFREIEEIPAF